MLRLFLADVISGRRRDLPARLVGAGLAALALPYRAGVELRRAAYRVGLLRASRAPLPVISIGNLTWGGTGKTPLTIYLARGLVARGRKPAVVTRGYGEPARTGQRPHAGVSDEAVVHAERLPGVPVIVSPRRIAGCREAAARGADVVLLDDGLQHLALRRDLELVLLDATNPFGNGRLLPGGILRESPRVLNLADVVILTRADQAAPADLARLRERLARLAPQAQVVTSRHRPEELRGWLVANEKPLAELRDLPVAVFSGIGHPEAFARTVRDLGARLVYERRFPDHHRFTEAEMLELGREAAAAGAALVLTTEKDAVKIRRDPCWNVPLYVLRVELEILDGEAALWQAVETIAAIPVPVAAPGAAAAETAPAAKAPDGTTGETAGKKSIR